MADTRKRKHAATEDQQPHKQTSAAVDIKAFGQISKAVRTESSSKKIKSSHDPEARPEAVVAPTAISKTTKRKRSSEEVSEEHDGNAPGAGIFKQFAKKTPNEQRVKRTRTALPPSPADTPSKDATALFDKLKLNAIPFSLANQRPGIDTPPLSPQNTLQPVESSWPVELQELCQLHAAFLTALSLHYAHNGTSSPAAAKTLCESTSRNWRKRSVNLDDLRRLLAVGHTGAPEFVLEDFGKAGICLSRSQARGRALKRAASFVDEDDLNSRFEEALQARWMRWQHNAEQGNGDAVTFVAQLPLQEITVNASVQKASPLFARGQQRLADMEAAQAESQTENKSSSAVEPKKAAQAVQNRGTSLLDRVLAKQACTAAMPAGPTKTQLERRAALHRIEDIARALGLLVSVKPRASMSMQAMVQQLQQSTRNPMSREEVERSLELMSEEVTPGFVKVIVTGAVKGVVISRASKPDAEVIRARVAMAEA